jgi:hypothetical protein
MQTFLPYPNFLESAKVLDRRRLGKQRVEAKQILQVLLDQSTAWQHHPAVKMWAGYTGQLALYGYTMCIEWIRRGYNDKLKQFFEMYLDPDSPVPIWLGSAAFHSSHRAALLLKGYQAEFGSRSPWPRNQLNFQLKCWGLPELRDCEMSNLEVANKYADDLWWKKACVQNPYIKYNWHETPTKRYIWPTVQLS